METVVVSTEVLRASRKRVNNINNPYNIDLWKEVKKRWMVFGVLAAILLAVIAPRIGAPGGPLHTEYLSYIPSSAIYVSAGARLGPQPPELPRLAATAVFHAHIVTPALCVCAVTVFGNALHQSMVSGALLSSLGGGCLWLTLAVSPHAAAAPVALACELAALAATPLSILLLCGRATIPPLHHLLPSLSVLFPLCAGAALRPSLPRVVPRAAALALLYVECCEGLAGAGGLQVGDVLAILVVEVWWVAASVCSCAAYARGGASAARLIAAAAAPKRLHSGWGACGSSRLPRALAAPAAALLLAGVHADADDELDRRWGTGLSGLDL